MIAITISHNMKGSVGQSQVRKGGCGGERITAATVLTGSVVVGAEVETILVVVLTSRCHHLVPTAPTTAGDWSLQRVVDVPSEHG